jgi:two-component system nitrogen regulation sensor histidine kinase NtrY
LRRPLGIRTRLLLAFGLVSVPPLLFLAASLTTLVNRDFESSLDDRLATGLKGVRDRITTLRGEVGDTLEKVADQDLPQAPPSEEGDRTLAETLGGRRNLPALEILDGSGKVISSRHWPAGYGLRESDTAFAGDPSLRLARVAADYASTERLALMPSRAAFLRGLPVTVRGGLFLDNDFLRDLSRLMGFEVAFRDAERNRWIAPAGFPLEGWSNPPLKEGAKGEVAQGGTSYRYVTARLAPSLLLVVAATRTPLDRLSRDLGRYSLLIAGAAFALAFLASLVLSGRIARPVRALVQGARQVAEGDLEGAVEVSSRDEIGQLAQAFNAMTGALRLSQERLLQAERVAAWREMARRLAHELKNPLFPIQLSIETLRRAFERKGGSGEDLDTLVRESTATILDEIAALKRIIEEFSEFARTPRPRLALLDVNGVVDAVLSLYRPRAQGVRIETDLEAALPPLEADRDLLSRALSNLVANALEAMPEGGRLGLATRSADRAVLIDVADSGGGLTPEQRSRLFTPYYTTKKGGTGLGLAIVQGIVSDHGGRIEVQSAPGEGTRFTLVFPLRANAQTVRSSIP